MNIYRINASENYLKELARFIFEQCSGDFVALSDCLILLPTKRACLHLKNQFCYLSKNNSIILPEISSIGEIDEEELNLENFINFEQQLNLKPAISNEKRLLITAELIRESKELRINDSEINFEQSIKLAKTLLQLVDDFNRYEVTFEKLEMILPEEISAHNQKTINFLNFFFEKYSEILEKYNLTDQITRRNNLINKLIENIKLNKTRKIFIAGTTGTMPATRRLIKQALINKNCHFILPYIDENLNKDDFADLLNENDHSNHQAHVAELLKYLEVGADEITQITPHPNLLPQGEKGYSDITSPPVGEVDNRNGDYRVRGKTISDIMLPASKVYKWNEVKPQKPENKKNINIIEAENEIEEAKLISLIIREKFEQEKTCAVVTNNKNLARILSTLFKNYNIKADASFGRQLNEIKEGRFILRIASLISNDLRLPQLLDLFKDEFSKKIKTEEIEFLENKIIRKNNLLKISDINLNDLTPYPDIQERIKYFQGLNNNIPHGIKGLIELTLEIASMLIDKNEDNASLEAVFEATEKILNELENEPIDQHLYADFLNEILANKSYRGNLFINNKLQILTPIEARLINFDCVILAGVNQGIWPKENNSPWLSDSMLKKTGLPDQEFYISAAAHDFAALMHRNEVYISYSRAISGKAAIKSQFVNRVATYFEVIGHEGIYSEQGRFKNYLKQLDNKNIIKLEPELIKAKPPKESRRNKISATAIDRTIENPYEFYAKNILKLRKLDPLEKQAEASDYGNFIHEVIEQFTNFHNFEQEKITISALTDIGFKIFQGYKNRGIYSDLWVLQLNILAPWLVETERKKAPYIEKFYSEISGEYGLKLDDGRVFKFTAQADRIEIYKDGTYRIIDFKTGDPPRESDVNSLKKPQLLVEALIAMKGEFRVESLEFSIASEIINLSNYKLAAVEYYRLKNSSKGFEIITIDEKLDELIEKTETEAKYLAEQILDENTAFLALPDGKTPKYSDYLHLMRVEK